MLKSYLNTKNILILSLIINFVLAFWVYRTYQQDPEINKELEKSKGRVEILEKELRSSSIKYDSLRRNQKIIDSLISKKPTERIKINTDKNEEIARVISLPIDSSIGYVAKRLSEVDLD